VNVPKLFISLHGNVVLNMLNSNNLYKLQLGVSLFKTIPETYATVNGVPNVFGPLSEIRKYRKELAQV